jgi:hypothetical protein
VGVLLTFVFFGAIAGVSGQQSDRAATDLSLKIALAALEDGNLKIALEQLDIAVKASPSNAIIHYTRALVLDKLGRSTDSLAALDEAERIGLPDTYRGPAGDLRATLMYKKLRDAPRRDFEAKIREIAGDWRFLNGLPTSSATGVLTIKEDGSAKYSCRQKENYELSYTSQGRTRLHSGVSLQNQYDEAEAELRLESDGAGNGTVRVLSASFERMVDTPSDPGYVFQTDTHVAVPKRVFSRETLPAGVKFSVVSPGEVTLSIEGTIDSPGFTCSGRFRRYVPFKMSAAGQQAFDQAVALTDAEATKFAKNRKAFKSGQPMRLSSQGVDRSGWVEYADPNSGRGPSFFAWDQIAAVRVVPAGALRAGSAPAVELACADYVGACIHGTSGIGGNERERNSTLVSVFVTTDQAANALAELFSRVMGRN